MSTAARRKQGRRSRVWGKRGGRYEGGEEEGQREGGREKAATAERGQAAAIIMVPTAGRWRVHLLLCCWSELSSGGDLHAEGIGLDCRAGMGDDGVEVEAPVGNYLPVVVWPCGGGVGATTSRCCTLALETCESPHETGPTLCRVERGSAELAIERTSEAIAVDDCCTNVLVVYNILGRVAVRCYGIANIFY